MGVKKPTKPSMSLLLVAQAVVAGAPSSLSLAAFSYVLPGACLLTPVVNLLDTCTQNTDGVQRWHMCL